MSAVHNIRALSRSVVALLLAAVVVVTASPPAVAVAPVAQDGTLQTSVDTPEWVYLDASDDDFDVLTYTIVTPPAHGTLDDCSAGSCTYTPDAGYLGGDSFTWKANDGTQDSNVATVTITVDPAPVPGVWGLQAASAGTGKVVLTWTNPEESIDGIIVRYSTDGNPTTPTDGTGFPVVGTPETVTVTGLTDGTLYYFSVFTQQSGSYSEPAMVQLEAFTCPDLTPALDAGGLVTSQEWVVCSGPDAHEPASTLNTVLPKTGSTQALMTTGDKTVALPPDDGSGEGTGNGSGSRGAYDVSIYRVDLNVPAGQTCLRFDYVFASEEYPEYVGSSYNDGFLAQLDQNDWTVEGNDITAQGNFAQFADGSYISVNSTVFAETATVHLPDTNGTGYDGMSGHLTASTPVTTGAHSIYLSIFDAGDSALDSAAFIDNLRTGTGTCTAGSNQPPVAVNDSATTPEDTPVQVSVPGNDSDADNDPLTVTSKTEPSHGTVTCTTTTCTYTPAADYHGPDSFTYTISDGKGGTDTATVSITVTPVNDPPNAVDDLTTTTAGTAKQVSVLANDSDVDGDPITVTANTQGAHGTVTCTSTTCTYTPSPGYVGADSFTYTISDGNGGTDTATVTVTVQAVTTDVSVTKSPWAANATVGSLTGYRIVVRNLSSVASEPVTLTDNLPARFKFDRVTATQCSTAGSTVTCAFGSLAPSQTITFDVRGAFTGPGAITNTAVASVANDAVPANNSATTTTTVTGKACTIIGTFGDDVPLNGTNKADVICGLSGNDRINGKLGNDTLYGNEGNDWLIGLGGNDLVDGGPGSDTTIYSALLQAVRVDLGLKKATGQGTDTLISIEHVTGSAKADTLVGNGVANTLSGLGGNDVLSGLGGPDTLLGGVGADTMNGGAGADVMRGGKGNDSFFGGAGKDVCTQGPGSGPKKSC